MDKPQNLQGFRDFLPNEVRERQFVVNKIKEIFERFGFEPLETPTLEYSSLLLGKYGTEADKLVYSFKDKGDRAVALRYDQTVPTARVLAQYQNILPKYFRRYQIQNVFRSEKPQQGRYREFTQCDIDIFGSTNSLSDAEIIACTYKAFKNVGFPNIVIKMNDRKILFETLEKYADDTLPILGIIQTIDKFDRIAESGVIAELVKKGMSEEKAKSALSDIRQAKPTSTLTAIMNYSRGLGVPPEAIVFEPTIARGLDYYTGMIFEVFLPEYPEKSYGGGGRYDNLIKQLCGVQVPAVGIAFGFDRMVEAARKLNLIPSLKSTAKILVTVFDETSVSNALAIANKIRDNTIAAEVFPSFEKLEKQLKYADQKNIPYVLIVGPDEVRDNVVVLKSMIEKTQERIPLSSVIQKLSKDE